MPLSWNEIKSRAVKFSKEWETETKEHAEAKSFWDGFFDVFGIGRRRIASFEEPVKKLGNRQGFIDLFWKGNLIVEHKSKGRDLDKAYQQAIDYFPGLREEELPKYILVSDFERFRLYDLDENEQHEFLLSELHQNVKLFGFIAGYQKITIRDEDPINIKAAEKMGKLHDMLKENGYDGHELEVYLVRLLFLLFADDTGIFEKDIFWDFVENHTAEDGSDLANKLAQLFQVLNRSQDKRLKNLDEIYTQFPYINGKLFEENLSIASFDSQMRNILLESCSLDWGLISPAIFGSLFQSIMDKTARRNLGAHYTSEKNILKLIKPLFLDELWAEFEKIQNNRSALNEFHDKISKLRFLDPACGSGNFLIIAYRELREIELKVVYQMLKLDKLLFQMTFLNIEDYFKVSVSQFYGIEIDEWAARIAEVAMWLVDHQMNIKSSNLVGKYLARIPLVKTAKVVNGNSLQIPWESLLNEEKTITIYANEAEIIQQTIKESQEKYGKVRVVTNHFRVIDQASPEEKPEDIDFNYILGNPPFIGKQLQTKEQKTDLEKVTLGMKGANVLDYVACWYLKAAKYIQGTNIKVAFVSTNSISQGEQVGILWNEMFNRYKIKIHFAHRTFRWDNEAKGNAAVHVVIVGFANFDTTKKLLFDYENIKAEAHEVKVKNINPYLIEGEDIVVFKRTNPISNVPSIIYGNKIVDGGNYLFNDEEKSEFIKKEPDSIKYFKPILSGDEFINGKNRWVLYLRNISPIELKKLPTVYERVKAVAQYRRESTKESTRLKGETPTLFAEPRQPENDFLLIPRTSSELRKYIPFGFYSKDYIVNDSCIALPNATLYLFGHLTSEMHITWVKYSCGRLKSDYRYSNTIVYNNYPFPKEVNDNQKERVEKAAQAVLDTRSKYPDSSLSDLYDPLAMPPDLLKAHKELDKAVDLCYRSQPFANERARIEFLFGLYSQYISPLQAEMDKQNKKMKIKNK
ncbi:MAG: class I SAM-dependent DNA methyltransferase [Bacteroidales bacterium]|nr:class I SAM-dependent DNA methyltransferase [Bacteroidales bacterium]